MNVQVFQQLNPEMQKQVQVFLKTDFCFMNVDRDVPISIWTVTQYSYFCFFDMNTIYLKLS